MVINGFPKRVRNLTILLREAQYSITLPKRSAVLIYGAVGLDALTSELENRNLSYEVVDVAAKSINVPILLAAFIRSLATAKPVFDSYISAYLGRVKPTWFITFIDNDPRFWHLSTGVRSAAKVVVQNGWRSEDFFPKVTDRGNLDLIMVFSRRDLLLFEQSSKIGKAIIGGSFISNTRPVSRVRKGYVLWISQFEEVPRTATKQLKARMKHFRQTEAAAFRTFSEWAAEEELPLYVMCRNGGNAFDREQKWFDAQAPISGGITYHNREIMDPYIACDESQMAGTCDSTLGIEALTRGTPVGFFLLRPNDNGFYSSLKALPDFYKLGELGRSAYKQLTAIWKSGGDFIPSSEAMSQDLMAMDEGNGEFWNALFNLQAHSEQVTSLE